MNCIFIQARFFCSHPDTQSAAFAITARTISTFWPFVDEVRLPEQGSSSTFSRPSLKAFCHLNTTVLNRVASPQASVKEANISVADLLSFTQNLIAYRFDIFLHRKRNVVTKHDHTQTAVAHDWLNQSSWNKHGHAAKVTTNAPIYIN